MKITITKDTPERTITNEVEFMVELTVAYSEAAVASIGVSMYFTTESYCKSLVTTIFWGTELVYWDRVDLMSYKTLTTPVVKPFCKTPELKL